MKNRKLNSLSSIRPVSPSSIATVIRIGIRLEEDGNIKKVYRRGLRLKARNYGGEKSFSKSHGWIGV
jgi:hypothetical protein